MASHYSTAVLATRPRLPKHKAKSRSPCKLPSAGSWRGCATSASFPWPGWTPPSAARPRTQPPPDARLRLQPRRTLGREIDRPKLGELPDQPYVFARWKHCRVARLSREGRGPLVFHALLPHPRARRIADKTVEIFHMGQRIASQRPSAQPAPPYGPYQSHAERASPLTASGRRGLIAAGERSVLPPPPSSMPSSLTGCIPNRAFAPVSASWR